MMPKDTNYMGSIFGGHILSLIDLAAAQKAREIKTLKFVTKIVKEVNFIAPVYVGDQVSFYTEVLKIGNSSVSVKVEVEAIRRSNTSLCEQVTSAEVILVAVDENNKAVKIG
ncbi:UNVERIFIED_CONTAM: hypothetical protein GTU68_029896 [Idotea baltica]|nr:hypothetical protein [Idotea baltica]